MFIKTQKNFKKKQKLCIKIQSISVFLDITKVNISGEKMDMCVRLERICVTDFREGVPDIHEQPRKGPS